MKREWYRYLWVLACFMVGCAALDSALGVNPDGSRSPGFIDGVIAPLANGAIPFSGTALTALAGIYAAWRGRKWRKVAESSFDVIEAGQAAWTNLPELKAKLNAVHDRAGVLNLAKLIVKKYGHSA